MAIFEISSPLLTQQYYIGLQIKLGFRFVFHIHGKLNHSSIEFYTWILLKSFSIQHHDWHWHRQIGSFKEQFRTSENIFDAFFRVVSTEVDVSIVLEFRCNMNKFSAGFSITPVSFSIQHHEWHWNRQMWSLQGAIQSWRKHLRQNCRQRHHLHICWSLF